MISLEGRARRAAADAHESITRLAVPDLAARRRRGTTVWFAVAAAAGIMVIVGFIALRDDTSAIDVRGEGSEGTGAIDAPTGSTTFRLGVPDGWSFVAEDFVGRETSFDPSWLTLYGAGDGDIPFADSDIAIVAAPDPRALQGDGEPITVRGHQGYVIRETEPATTRVAIEWLERDDLVIQLASRSLTVEDLVRLASDLAVEDNSVSLPNPPGETELLIDGLPAEEYRVPLGGQWLLSVADPATGIGGFVIGGPVPRHGLLIPQYVYGAVDATPVRGTTGYRGVDEGVGFLVWIEGDTLVTISGDPSTDLVAIAEVLVPVSADEWEALVGQNLQWEGGDTSNEVAEMLHIGSTEVDGTDAEWFLYVSMDGHLCLDVQSGDGGFGSCSAPRSDIHPISAGVGTGGGFTTIDGWVEPAVARLVLITRAGDELDLDLHPTSSGDLAFGALLDPSDRPVLYLASGVNGSPLWQHDVDADGPDLEAFPEYPTAGSGPGEILGTGIEGDLMWSIARTDDGQYCMDIFLDREAHSTCGESPVVSFPISDDGLYVLVGDAPPCTEAVRVIGANQEAVRIDVGQNGADAITFAAMIGFEPIRLTAEPRPDAEVLAVMPYLDIAGGSDGWQEASCASEG